MSRIRSLLTCALALVLSGGCASTLQQKPETPQNHGFLDDVYDKLQPGEEGQLALRYVKPNVDWLQYQSILLGPIQYWSGSDSSISPDAAQMLTSYFYNEIKENLEKQKFPLAQLPGPGVLRVQLALTDASPATPVLRTVSLVLPQALLLNSLQRMFSGRYGFAGHLEVAVKASDAHTGELLAAALDRRSGGGGIQQAAQWQWGDAESAMDTWAEFLTKRLAELRDKMKAR